MTERRRIQRRSISYYMRVIDATENQMIGHLADITLTGLRMDSQNPIKVSKEYRLRIYTTSDVADKDFIEFGARTRWCNVDPVDPGVYDIGFEIIKITPHDSEIVKHIMDKYSSQQNSFMF
jgi:nicotinic acid phosphoribosyltransferase